MHMYLRSSKRFTFNCFCICRFKLAFGEIAAVLAGTRFEVICSLLRLAVLAT